MGIPETVTRVCLPGDQINVIDEAEMLVPADQRDSVLTRECGDPDVIFRNRGAFCTEFILYLAVFPRCIAVNEKNAGLE